MTDSRQIRKEFLKEQEKLVINLQKRYNKLRQIQRNMGYADLVPPIRSGWIRSFSFRSFVKDRKEYKTVMSLLPLIQNEVVCDNKEFVTPKRRHRKAKPVEQNLRSLNDRDYDALESDQQRFFVPVWKRHRYWNTAYRVWEFNKPQWLDFSVKPHYIRKVRLFDADVEKELEEINDRLWGKEDLYQRYAKDKPSSHREYGPKVKEKILYREVLKEVKEAL